jgi:hypothetical protein
LNKGIWAISIYALIVTIWYHPVIDHISILFLIFLFVAAAFAESKTKRLSNEAIKDDTLSKREAESKFEELSDSLTELRDKLRGHDFVPYSVSVRVNCDRANLFFELMKKMGFFDGKKWINGVRFSEARPGHELRRGIYFQVLSSEQDGYPKLVYRIDGKTPRFQTGLTELRRAIEEFSFEDVKTALDPASEAAFRAISGPKHPILFFGSLLRDSSDAYQIAFQVDEDWWNGLADKPEIECQIVRKGDAYGPFVSVYLILARIPRRVIHGEASGTWTPELQKQHETQL